MIDDKQKVLHCLRSVGYYRLSGYLYSFRQQDPNDSQKRQDYFIDGSHFDEVWQLYLFDKKLRLLAIEALEHIEIAIRNTMAYVLGEYDPLVHHEEAYFCFDDKKPYSEWRKKYRSHLQRHNKADFVNHHLIYYGGELPIWAAVEIWDFGLMSTLYQVMPESDKDKIAKIYHFPTGKQLQTCLRGLNNVRNIAAHHDRLWNRAMVFQPNIKGMKDKNLGRLNKKKVFIYFCLIKRLLDVICPNSDWGDRFLHTLHEFPKVQNNAINLQQMGIPADFPLQQWQLWQQKRQTKESP